MTKGSLGRWMIIGGIAVAALVVGGPLLYFTFISDDAPPPLTLSTDPPSESPAGSVAAEGTWRVSEGSVVGYRVKEILFGQSAEAAGRTREVTGEITISGTSVTGGSFTAQMESVRSDQSRRDNQFRGRIMNVGIYPTATFKITQPISLDPLPAAGERRTFDATGELTLHGVTRTVTFKLAARLTGSVVQVAGSIPVVFADYDIPNPSFGPAQTEDNGVLEFSLNFRKTS